MMADRQTTGFLSNENIQHSHAPIPEQINKPIKP
jgi:hypothetical protein